MSKMKNILQKTLKEPLFYFLLLGFILYMLLDKPNIQQHSIEVEKLTLQSIDKNSIKNEYKSIYHNNPDKNILKAFSQYRLYEKILLRESIRLKLHENDSSIKELLLHKMKQIINKNVEEKKISEVQLVEYYKANIEDYSKKNSISFYQLFFQDEATADKTLAILSVVDIKPPDAQTLSQDYKREYFIKNISKASLKNLYGNYFTLKVFQMKKGLWHKKVHSKYGFHLIFIRNIDVQTPLKFEEVQSRVYKDFKAQSLNQIYKDAYKKMLN